ncbi:MAG: molecular chaperone TorD family protein [Phycisphaerales bacterium]|nr:MAG: molecular chaperone TorD family protein [Phycisphaerales bacterium]
MTITSANTCQRADRYRLLSDCYYLPDAQLVQRITDAVRTDPLFADLACCVPGALELEALKIDFASLFVGPYELLAPPYGSVYLEDDRVMGDSTIDVGNCYASEGLDITIKDAPDHIAVELEFMHYLAVRQMEATRRANLQAIQRYQQKQYSFLQTHLARWLPEFADNVRENARTAFYKHLAQITAVFVREDLGACT